MEATSFCKNMKINNEGRTHMCPPFIIVIYTKLWDDFISLRNLVFYNTQSTYGA